MWWASEFVGEPEGDGAVAVAAHDSDLLVVVEVDRGAVAAVEAFSAVGFPGWAAGGLVVDEHPVGVVVVVADAGIGGGDPEAHEVPVDDVDGLRDRGSLGRERLCVRGQACGEERSEYGCESESAPDEK